ncbi:MAG: LysE family translocator [Acidobacteria bacterium]|nr:MAG: LysE family translocator [Acidobacteriota bacterium]
MPEPSTLVLFVAAALVLLVTPGPAVLYVVARSIEQGPRAGFVSSLGLSVGGFVHVLAATLGLSAILVSSATAFGIVKMIGAGYLVYLGLRTLLNRDNAAPSVSDSPRGMWRIFRDGVIVNLFNPKAALFFFAFLPQFVDPARGNVALQFLGLGLLFEALGLMSDSTYALLAGTVGGWLRTNEKVRRAQRYLTGSVYLGLGVAMALSGRPEK